MRLMQTGRMKGQAFVGLPDENVAARALKETNGYILHGKAMVVVRACMYVHRYLHVHVHRGVCMV